MWTRVELKRGHEVNGNGGNIDVSDCFIRFITGNRELRGATANYVIRLRVAWGLTATLTCSSLERILIAFARPLLVVRCSANTRILGVHGTRIYVFSQYLFSFPFYSYRPVIENRENRKFPCTRVPATATRQWYIATRRTEQIWESHNTKFPLKNSVEWEANIECPGDAEDCG